MISSISSFERTVRAACGALLAASLAGCGGPAGVPELPGAPAVDDFLLIDQAGRAFQLSRPGGAQLVVLYSYGVGCPIARQQLADLRAIAEARSPAVRVLLVDAVPQDDRAALVREAADYEIALPILRDDRQLVSEALGLGRTGEAVVIDPKRRRLLWRGPVDDRLDYGTQRPTAAHAWLDDALGALLRGRAPTPAGSEARGCLVSLPASRAARAELGLPAPDYVHDVAPVLAAHCQRCHRPGGIGPWAMTGYEVVRGWAPMMREVIRTRRMPPWHADPDASALRSDLPLSVAEAQAIVHWAEEGARRGDGDDPLAIPLPEAPVWPLGEPDLLFTLPEQKVPANGVIPYRHVETDLGLTEPTWICAAQVAAGNRGALHHANVLHVDSDMIASGRRGAALWQNNLLSSYVPGMYEGDVWPSGTGRLLLPGEKLRTTLHYNTTGKRERDVTRIGLYRCESPPERVYRVKAVLDMDLTIPAGAVMDHVASWRPDGPIRIFRIFPHMHYRGAAFTLEVETPDGDRRTLLRVPRYDFGWQRWYDLAAPVDLPAGSTVIATTTFDNTAENPANPDPGRAVPWGEQSDDEMAIGYVAWEAL